MNTSVCGATLVVALSAEETALWCRGDSQEAARWRLAIKRPTRREKIERGLAGHVVVDHAGRFLEDCEAHVRRCDPATIEARCCAWDVWIPSLPPSAAGDLSALVQAAGDAGDVVAWLRAASEVYWAEPCVDLDPASPTGAAVVDAANRRLLAAAMRP
jgi:hypothetical protein